MKKVEFPCPCGGKLKWKRERIVKDTIDCGVLDVEYCEKCGEEYLPDTSMEVVEDKLKAAGLWGMERKEVKFWKTGKAITIRIPSAFVKKLGLEKISKGYVYQEGKGKLSIEY